MKLEKNVNQILLAKTALHRLERISADSRWAHQASGIRASLAKALSQGETNEDSFPILIKKSFLLLEKAAAEIPED